MDFHSILGKLRAIESLGTQGIDDRLHEAEGCTMTAEGEACPVHGMEECDGYQGTIQMEDSRGEMMDSDTSRDDHAERAGRKVARDIEYDERKKDGIHGRKRGAEDNKAERAGRRVTKDIEYDDKKAIKEGSAHGYNVVKWYAKHGDQLKLVKWLKKEAGLPKEAQVYFDDADLVYDNETIVPNALVNSALKLNDLLTAVARATGGTGKTYDSKENIYRETRTAATNKMAEMFSYPADKSPAGQRERNKPLDNLSRRNPGDIAKYGADYKAMQKGKSSEARRMKSMYAAGGPKSALPESDLPDLDYEKLRDEFHDMRRDGIGRDEACEIISGRLEQEGYDEDDYMGVFNHLFFNDEYPDEMDDEYDDEEMDEAITEAVDPKTLVRDIVSAVRDMYEDQGFVGSGDQHDFKTVEEFKDFLEMNELEKFARQLEKLSDADKNRVFRAAIKRINKILASGMEEDAPLGPPPFAGPGATNNGPDTAGYVYAYSESQKQLRESMNIVMNQNIDDQGNHKSISVTATDEDFDKLERLLTMAGIGRGESPAEIVVAAPRAGMPYGVAAGATCPDCGGSDGECSCDSSCSSCGGSDGQCTCDEVAMENADHDFGHDEHAEAGEPLDVKDYEWNGPHINQRFGKIGDNTLMAERANSLFAALNEQYTDYLMEAELETSNAGSESPLTANARDAFDKDPFADEKPVTDGSRSPLSHIGRQDVMN